MQAALAADFSIK